MRRKLFPALCLAMVLLAGCSSKSEKQARDAFLYGYPLVMMSETQHSSPGPVNTLYHRRSFPDDKFRTVVRPNVDTLYSIGWLDLKDDALVLSLPDSDGRYILTPMLDAWTNVFASIGSRTTGTKAGSYVIAGPDWTGDVPEGMTLYRSPTAMAWMIGRIYAAGPDDFEGAYAYQDGMSLRTLTDYQNGVVPPAPSQPKPSFEDIKKKLKDMDAQLFFEKLEALMTDNPPAKEDAPFIEDVLAPLMASGPSAETLSAGKDKAYGRLDFIQKLVARKKGWMNMDPSRPIGAYGTDYQMRAYITHVGLGANEPVDAIYPNTTKDVNGHALHSSKNYVVHFAKDELPPVKAFWSLTVYDEDGYLVKNDIGRYALGTANNLPLNADGSLDIYVQREAPSEDKISNWLPTPEAAPFALTLRLYWPEEQVLKGAWNAPTVTPLSAGHE